MFRGMARLSRIPETNRKYTADSPEAAVGWESKTARITFQ